MSTGIRTGGAGPPENITRNRQPIPAKPDLKWAESLMGEISRVRTKDPEMAILLQHMVKAFQGQLDVVWEALDILDKRYDEFDFESVFDTEYREVGRSTSRRERTVESTDGDLEVDLLDVITQETTMKGNKTGRRIKFLWNEPLPV